MALKKRIEVEIVKGVIKDPFTDFILRSSEGTRIETYIINNAVRYVAEVMLYTDREIYWGNYVYEKEDGTVGYKPAVLIVMNNNRRHGEFRIYELDL